MNESATGGKDASTGGGTTQPATGGDTALAAGGTGGGSASSSSGGAGTGGNADSGEHSYNCNDPSTLPATFDMIRTCIIKPGCARSTCHDGEVPLLLIDTWDDFPRREEHSSYDTLAETLLNHRVEKCGAAPLVTPFMPEDSALIKALIGDCNDPEDPDWIMPQGCRTVNRCAPPEYVDLVAEWIAMGASMP